MKLIICEKCFVIPKITILNSDTIQLDCPNCNSSTLNKLDYFAKFTKENDELFSLPNCNFTAEHVVKSGIFCIRCNKYLCENCLANHGKIFETEHIKIKQKINHRYYCAEKGHEENVLNSFCLKCSKYLCSACKERKDSHAGHSIYI